MIFFYSISLFKSQSFTCIAKHTPCINIKEAKWTYDLKKNTCGWECETKMSNISKLFDNFIFFIINLSFTFFTAFLNFLDTAILVLRTFDKNNFYSFQYEWSISMFYEPSGELDIKTMPSAYNIKSNDFSWSQTTKSDQIIFKIVKMQRGNNDIYANKLDSLSRKVQKA